MYYAGVARLEANVSMYVLYIQSIMKIYTEVLVSKEPADL